MSKSENSLQHFKTSKGYVRSLYNTLKDFPKNKIPYIEQNLKEKKRLLSKNEVLLLQNGV